MRSSSRSSLLFRASPFGILAIVFLLFTNPASAASERGSWEREIAGPPTALVNNNAEVVITHLSLLDVSRQRDIQERKLKHWRVNKGATYRKRKYKGRKQDDNKREGKKDGKERKSSRNSTKGYTRQPKDDSCMPLNDRRDLLEDGTSHRWLMTNRNEKKWRHWQGRKKQENKYYKYKKKETKAKKPKTSAPTFYCPETPSPSVRTTTTELPTAEIGSRPAVDRDPNPLTGSEQNPSLSGGDENSSGNAKPTDGPTSSPTSSPTNSPTASPTTSPTTRSPTSPPTLSMPRRDPTSSPTKSPATLPSPGSASAPANNSDEKPTLAPTIVSSEPPSMEPSEVPSGMPSLSCGTLLKTFVSGQQSTMGKHKDDEALVGTCDRTNVYVEENPLLPHTMEDFGQVMEKSNEGDRCVTVEFWHDVDDDESCGELFTVLAYDRPFNPNNKAAGFLGYGDYYHEYTFSVTLPKNKPLHLVAVSFWDNTEDDAGGDCYMEFIIDDGDC